MNPRDRNRWRAVFMAVACLASVPLLARAQQACVGDCNSDGRVTVDELITGVNIALGTSPPGSCPTLDSNDSGEVSVDELVTAVNQALTGCPVGSATPTKTVERTPTPTGSGTPNGALPPGGVDCSSVGVTDCPRPLRGENILAFFDESYDGGPFGGTLGAHQVTRLDTYWTDGEDDPKNCSSVLNSVNLDENGDGKPDDPRDIDNYASYENQEDRNLDVYVPSNLPKFPLKKVFFFVHGGAWVDSTKTMYNWLPGVFTGREKWITVVTEYRMLDPGIVMAADCDTKNGCADPGFMNKAAWWPDPIRDVADAFSWVTEHIAEYGGDVDDIYIMGQSAGGNLVSLLALHPDYETLRPFIRGVVTMSPPSDLSWLAYGSPVFDRDLSPPMPCALLYQGLFDVFFEGCTTGPVPDEYGRQPCEPADLHQASPTWQVRPGMAAVPRFLVMQGGSGTDAFLDRDMPCLKTDIDSFVETMAQAGYRADSIVMDGYGHASSVASLAYRSAAEEPATVPLGEYDDAVTVEDECYVPLGPQLKGRNVTQEIVDWIEGG